MRVSTNFQFETYSNRISEAQSRYFEAQERVMTGKRFNRVSDDPVAAMTSISARSLRSRLDQLRRNLLVAQEYAGSTEHVLDETGRLARRAYTLAIQGASDATSQESREAMAREIGSLQERVVDLANTQGSGGKFFFAGQMSDTKPFSAIGGTLTFAGDTLPILVEVRPGETMRVNLENADTFFADVYNALENLRANLLGGDIGLISDQDVGAMRAVVDEIGAARGTTGVKLADIKRLETEGQRRIDDLTKTISDNEDIDLADAITQMQMAETAYSAALQVTSQGFGLSLMDFLR